MSDETHSRERDAEPEQRIIQGDCMAQMAEMDENSVHAVVSDPPYGIAFMPGVNEWDSFGSQTEYQEWCEQWASEALRVLKPGGHLIAFGGNRTHHRLMVGVEDAGFEIRDTLTYHYGTGFPKGSDVSKHIDRYHDEEGEYGAPRDSRAEVDIRRGTRNPETWNEGYRREWMDDPEAVEKNAREYIPATSQAERWEGFRSNLKPSTEFAVLARAPMSEDAIYKNVLAHGTGALNIDGTRIPVGDAPAGYWPGDEYDNVDDDALYGMSRGRGEPKHENGRYPANLLLDGVAARLLDEQTGEKPTGGAGGDWERSDILPNTTGTMYGGNSGYDDEGGASRFFYTSKSSQRERNCNGEVDNEHSTVKPLDLMEWLVTLVTAPGQTVLDPFAGSGTTIMACKRLGREGVGIEKDPDHADLARERVELAHELETDTDFQHERPAREQHSQAADGADGDEGEQEEPTLESFGDD